MGRAVTEHAFLNVGQNFDGYKVGKKTKNCVRGEWSPSRPACCIDSNILHRKTIPKKKTESDEAYSSKPLTGSQATKLFTSQMHHYSCQEMAVRGMEWIGE